MGKLEASYRPDSPAFLPRYAREVLRLPVGSGKWSAGLCGLSGLTRFRTSARWLERQGCSFGTQKGSQLKVYFGGNQTILPMHPKKELKTGTIAGIKKRLGLK